MFGKNRLVLLAILSACLVSGGIRASEVTDLKAKLDALEDQMDKEKDKVKKEDLKKQEKQLKQQLKAAKEKEKLAAKAAEKAGENAGKDRRETAATGKAEAKGLNKFARFWTEEIGKPMRKFFHGD